MIHNIEFAKFLGEASEWYLKAPHDDSMGFWIGRTNVMCDDEIIGTFDYDGEIPIYNDRNEPADAQNLKDAVLSLVRVERSSTLPGSKEWEVLGRAISSIEALNV